MTFQGKSGAVNGQLANRTNSFADWMRHPISVGSMLMSALGVGAFGAMLGASLGSSVLPMFFTGAAIGLAVSAAIMAGIGLLVVAQHARR